MGDRSLTVTFLDRTYHIGIAEAEGAVFGRGASIDVDSNPFLSRRTGRFVPADGGWWVQNLARTPLQVTTGGVTSLLGSGQHTALCSRRTVVGFTAGSARYELIGTLQRPVDLPPLMDPPEEITTRRFRAPTLNDEQRILVLALAESRLRGATLTHPARNTDVAERLGWSLTKLNRKLDWLCRRLDQIGVEGMRSGSGRATQRRLALVDYAVTSGLVSPSDLVDLDHYVEQVSAEPTS